MIQISFDEIKSEVEKNYALFHKLEEDGLELVRRKNRGEYIPLVQDRVEAIKQDLAIIFGKISVYESLVPEHLKEEYKSWAKKVSKKD